MITINISTPILGPSHILTVANVSNWTDVIAALPDNSTTPCTFTMTYNNVTYTGVVSQTSTTEVLVVFATGQTVALPSGMCLIVECPNTAATTTDCPNVAQTLTDATKLAVLDANGCQVGFVTFAEIKADLMSSLPQTLCDLLGVTEIPMGNLAAGDRILTTSGGCTMKSVPQSDVACP